MGGRGASSGLGRGDEQKQKPKKIAPKREAKDVTEEYLRAVAPGSGTITYDDNYNVGKHRNEISVAQTLNSRIGGDILLINEKGAKTPSADYQWNGRLWELKEMNAMTKNAADVSVRKALKQILPNPGGVILKYNGVSFPKDLLDVISNRVRRSSVSTVDIILLGSNDSFQIFRYKK